MPPIVFPVPLIVTVEELPRLALLVKFPATVIPPLLPVKVPDDIVKFPIVRAVTEKLEVPVVFKVVSALIERVPPELTAPVRFIVAAPVVVNCALAAVPLKVIPAPTVIVPVVAETTEIPEDVPAAIVKSPVEVKEPSLTTMLLVTVVVGALKSVAPVLVRV